jgi:hypothetical protein
MRPARRLAAVEHVEMAGERLAPCDRLPGTRALREQRGRVAANAVGVAEVEASIGAKVSAVPRSGMLDLLGERERTVAGPRSLVRAAEKRQRVREPAHAHHLRVQSVAGQVRGRCAGR